MSSNSFAYRLFHAITFERKVLSKIHESKSKKSLRETREYRCLLVSTDAEAARAVTDGYIHDNYSNPRACAPRVNDTLSTCSCDQCQLLCKTNAAGRSTSDFRRGGLKSVARVGDTELNLERAFSEKFDFKRPSQGCLSISLQFKKYDYEAVIIACNIPMLR